LTTGTEALTVHVMGKQLRERRAFLKACAGLAAVAGPVRGAQAAPQDAPATRSERPRIRFAVIGLNHGHIYDQVSDVLRGGGELVSFHAKEADLADAFARRFPQARLVREEREILEDGALHLVLSAGIPDERAPLGVRVMQHGKDYMADKPGVTTLEQLAEARRVQKETRRIYSIRYGERLGNRAVVRAGELVQAGAIGRVIQTIGLGPHRVRQAPRPDWFWDKQRYGGILCDLASHEADQFLFFTGSTRAEVVTAQVGNLSHPERASFEDFGDLVWRGDRGTGYVRVDWFTPEGLGTWGDGRLTILGTDGYIEVRQNVDIAGRKGGGHLFLVDQKETRYVDCSDQALRYGAQLVADVVDRTETAMPQAHCFLATELALRAQKAAVRLSLGA
jgi:predicted dehydrogenase